MKPDRRYLSMPDRLFSRLSVRMWIAFTLLASVITILFWLILSNSVRLTYENENIADMDRIMWTAFADYGSDEFYDQLRLIAGGQGYYVQVLSEQNEETLFATGMQNEEGTVDFPDVLPENLFQILDDNGGDYSFSVDDRTGNGVWAVHAIVTANVDGCRHVLIFCKSLMNVENLLHLFGKRVIFAFIAVLVISSLLALVITHFFADPIRRLTKKARQMAAGDYTVEFPDEGSYEVRQLSQTLELAATEFDAAERTQKEFFANISHDMRTPLTVIRMFAEMIQTVSGDNPPKRAEHLERIQTEAEKLNGMINDTMDLARLQSGTQEVKMKSFDLAHLIESTVSSSAIRYDGSAIGMEMYVEQRLYVNADRKLISRVLQNYISNAVKFSMDEKRIVIRAYRNGDEIRTEVQDFGPGIASDDIPNVWTRYYTVDPYGNNKYGTGLGLNIVSEIMKLHDGANYGVDSELEKGSTFWFSLKAAEKPSDGNSV